MWLYCQYKCMAIFFPAHTSSVKHSQTSMYYAVSYFGTSAKPHAPQRTIIDYPQVAFLKISL